MYLVGGTPCSVVSGKVARIKKKNNFFFEKKKNTGENTGETERLGQEQLCFLV